MNSKKLIIILSIILIGLMASLLIKPQPQEVITDYSTYPTLESVNYQPTNQEHILYIYSNTCGYCEQIKAITFDYYETINQTVPMYFVDVYNVKDYNYLTQNGITAGTPTVAHYNNGQYTLYSGTDNVQMFYDTYQFDGQLAE